LYCRQGLPQAVLIGSRSIADRAIVLGIRCVGLNHQLSPEPGVVGVMVRVYPIVNKDQFRVGFHFVSWSVLGFGSRRLKRNLLPADAIQPITRAKVSVKLEGAFPLLKLLDLFVCLFQKS
jgi:hypothetical protein